MEQTYIKNLFRNSHLKKCFWNAFQNPNKLDIKVSLIEILLLNGATATAAIWKTSILDKKFIHTNNYNVLAGIFFILLHLGR